MKKLLYTVVIVAVAAVAFIIFQPKPTNDSLGEIEIIIVDQIGDTVSHKTISFVEEDTLFDILDQHYELGCSNNQFQLSDVCEPLLLGSRVILKIDDVETDWTNNYIGIYVNDEYAISGIDLIPLEDGTIYRFEYTEVGGETS